MTSKRVITMLFGAGFIYLGAIGFPWDISLVIMATIGVVYIMADDDVKDIYAKIDSRDGVLPYLAVSGLLMVLHLILWNIIYWAGYLGAYLFQ